MEVGPVLLGWQHRLTYRQGGRWAVGLAWVRDLGQVTLTTGQWPGLISSLELGMCAWQMVHSLWALLLP